jgi:chromosome segregation ATPase
MNALQIHTRKDLPSDPEKLREYSWNLTLAYQQLVEKYRKLLGNQFGKSSEKLRVQADLDALQMEMDELLSQIAALQDSESEEKEDIIEITAHNRRRKKYGRNSIPAELIEDVVVDFSEEEKKCSECGSELHQFATKAHIVVERIPAKYEVKRYIMPVYGCPCCKSGVTYKEMPLVSPIPKGVAGISLLLFFW